MKRTRYRNWELIISLGLIFSFGSCATLPQKVKTASSEPLSLDVVYPRPQAGDKAISLPAVDSTFAFGSVKPPQAQVWVNGTPAQVWENGAFLAFFPLGSKQKEICFTARLSGTDSLSLILPIQEAGKQQKVDGKQEAKSSRLNLPALLEIVDDHAVLRTAPYAAYLLFPLKGTIVWADSNADSYYRVHLAEGWHGWIEDRFVKPISIAATPTRTNIATIQVQGSAPWAQIEISMKTPLLYRLEENPEKNSLLLDFFGAVSKINRIDYDAVDPLVRELRWRQLSDDLLGLEIILGSNHLWGYGVDFKDDCFILKIRQPLRIERSVLRYRRICL
ncbi:MAG: hypothetical protein ABH878_02390, partial [bacterium]